MRLVRYLKAHPILGLALLTPGIPEYLSTSSPVLNIVANPVWFFLQLAINVGQYTAGALLIREAAIRWGKGWGTIVVLGLAYGVTEEGLGDNTLFNSNHGSDGVLGVFGHFAGVNWVWATGVLAFHVIYSIGLPILLLGLAIPETRGRSLLGRRGILLALVSLAATTGIETALVFSEFHFWMGLPLLVGSLVVIGALVAVARWMPASLGRPSDPRPSLSARQAIALGFAFFPVALLLEYSFTSSGAPPAVIILIELGFFAAMVEAVRRGVGRSRNEYVLVNLAFGFVLWQAAFGLLLTLNLPYTTPFVIVAIVFFYRLRKAYSPVPQVGEFAVPRRAPLV
jgi:hypothetical protein